MTTLINNTTLELIEKLRQETANETGIDPQQIPPFVMTDQKNIFPVIHSDTIAEIKSGNKGLLNSTIDHTILKADATPDQIKKICDEAIQNKFIAVCINSGYVGYARECLGDSMVNLCSVVGFPLGQMSTKAKASEAKTAALDGATEIDMVINVGMLKAREWRFVMDDISEVVVACKVPVKVIIETALLTEEEKIVACLLSTYSQAAFVKTSTGFSTGGATIEDVALMRAVVQKNAGVKASGGIKTFEDTIKMIEAGANRIGTSSGMSIIG